MNIPRTSKKEYHQPSFLFGDDQDEERKKPSKGITFGGADEDDDEDDVNVLKKLLSTKGSDFLQNALLSVDAEVRQQMLKILKEDELSVSPTRWDCPIPDVGVMFPQHKNRGTVSPVLQPIPSPTIKPIGDGPRIDIVVPSLSVDPEELKKIQGATYYEERQLYSILSLRDPDTRIIYVTSMPLHPSIVNYYLSLISSGSDRPQDRLTLFSTFDSSDKPLCQKILERPRLQQKIKRTIDKLGGNNARLLCFIPTELEHNLAKALDIYIDASPKDVQFWGSKCGSRQIFRDCGIPLPAGCFESIFDEDSLAASIADLWDKRPHLSRVVVKLNEGFSGEGNAMLDMRPIASRLYANYKFTPRSKSGGVPFTKEERLTAIKKEFSQLRFQAESETWNTFHAKIKVLGCIVEEFIEGQGKQSPSVQGIVHPDGSVEIVSSHEQVLGGADDQVYLGCRFPADSAYKIKLHEYCHKVALSLSEKGARGRFGVDFIAAPQKPWDFEHWDIFALEINLRQGGTTHPYETMHLLTGGHYSMTTGVYTSERGQEKYYIASDNVKKSDYQGLLPSDLMTIIGNHNLLFDDSTHTGVVFHLMGCLSQYGKVGVTCIGNTLEDAEDMYAKVVAVLDSECTSEVSSDSDDLLDV